MLKLWCWDEISCEWCEYEIPTLPEDCRDPNLINLHALAVEAEMKVEDIDLERMEEEGYRVIKATDTGNLLIIEMADYRDHQSIFVINYLNQI